MKTFYIPVHFYEQDPEDDDLVMLITQRDISDDEINDTLQEISGQYFVHQDSYASLNDMVDNIFSALAEKVRGVWSYCTTLPQLVVGEDYTETDNRTEFTKIDTAELAAMLVKLNTGDSITFYESYDDETHETSGAFGVTLINRFETDVLLFNYYGGGYPFVIDITEYDSDLKRIKEDLSVYLRDVGIKNSQVFVDARLLERKDS